MTKLNFTRPKLKNQKKRRKNVTILPQKVNKQVTGGLFF